MNRSYTDQQRRRAIEVYKRTQSVTKTTRQLGFHSLSMPVSNVAGHP